MSQCPARIAGDVFSFFSFFWVLFSPSSDICNVSFAEHGSNWKQTPRAVFSYVFKCVFKLKSGLNWVLNVFNFYEILKRTCLTAIERIGAKTVLSLNTVISKCEFKLKRV